MEKTKLTAIGIIKSLRKDRKGVQLTDGVWYSNKFAKTGLDHVNIGDEVKITYIANGEWKNYETVEVTKKSAFPPAFQQADMSMRPEIQPVMTREDMIKNKRFDSASFAISYAVRLAEAKVIEVKDINEKAKELLSVYEELLDSNLVLVQKIEK